MIRRLIDISLRTLYSRDITTNTNLISWLYKNLYHITYIDKKICVENFLNIYFENFEKSWLFVL